MASLGDNLYQRVYRPKRRNKPMNPTKDYLRSFEYGRQPTSMKQRVWCSFADAVWVLWLRTWMRH